MPAYENDRLLERSAAMQNLQTGVSVPVGAPDSELCQRATALVAELSPAFLFNHCARSFLFGDAIGKRDGLQYDRELLYLSAMLHDLGLTDSYLGADQRFELEGADRARAFLVEQGLEAPKADVVWDAIALNSTFGIALRKGTQEEVKRLSTARKEDAHEHHHDQGRHPDLLQGLGQRTARGLQPWLAAHRGCV
jgi:hypothetical protein